MNASNPPIIDHFLRLNPALRELGKLLIADTLNMPLSSKGWKERSHFGQQQPDFDAHREHDDWVRFLIHELTSSFTDPSEIYIENSVSFITFNYDMSLERRIINGLSANEVFPDDNKIKKLAN